MKTLTFAVEGADKELPFTPVRLINAGYTGRNQEAVQKHVEELKSMGIPAPKRTPAFFPKDADRIQMGGEIHPLDEDCSSEVETVLLVTRDGWYITVGCDIFDYKVEGLQADKSKSLYPNFLAAKAWRYEEIKDHWDQLVMRSWLGKERAQLYQEGTLEQIMTLEDMMEALKPFVEGGLVEGTVVSCGTLGCLVDGMPYTDFFEFELEDPVLGRKLGGSYELKKLSWYQEA